MCYIKSMKNILTVYFENFFNSRVIVQKYNLQYQANFLIYGRTFYTVQIQDLKFLVVITKNDEKFNISQYTRQQEIMFTNEKMNVVFYFESVTYSQQEAFIKNHLSPSAYNNTSRHRIRNKKWQKVQIF